MILGLVHHTVAGHGLHGAKLVHHWLTSGADWFMLEGRGYQFWSGLGSGSPVIVGVFVFWRRHTCSVVGCPRVIWKNHGDMPLCRRHHPDDPPAAGEVR